MNVATTLVKIGFASDLPLASRGGIASCAEKDIKTSCDESSAVILRAEISDAKAENDAKSDFPAAQNRFRQGYEASFLALEGNPIEDFRNLRRIKLRFKQGVPLQP